ncbi:unnamed protein product [Prorocentrum cordatum]|uniref:ADP ribosyltransferase domain-containing protein n=1 Tax=Prorocentrum cordatum TaxID=2364126 RepID=A0ABN9RZ32_9DINO|nr:unnamed protein product [Polarella glacialis]
MVGSPEANPVPAIEREHCLHEDSHVPFTTSNYGVTTTSAVEWAFVYLHQPQPPVEIVLQSGDRVSLDLPGDWPHEKPDKCKNPRAPLTPEDNQTMFEGVNGELQKIREVPLIWAEFYAARLYTGPMFQKYNAVLRGGALNMQQPTKMVSEFANLCCSNRYVTTIHAISSAVVKLGKRTRTTAVFRGFKDGRLPDSFTTPNADGVCGGIECGFLSTTTNRAVATSYAGTGVATVLQMEMGMVDRGADLSDLSQYPGEAEVLFGPLTSLQAMATTVQGSTLVVHVRPNINLTNTTMDRVLAKRRVLIEGMCEGLTRECQRFLSEANGLWRMVLDGSLFRLYESFEHVSPEIREAALSAAQVTPQEGSLVLSTIQRQLPDMFRAVYQYPDEEFTIDDVFKERVAEALRVKESIRHARGRVLQRAAGELEGAGTAAEGAAAQRARRMALALEQGEHVGAQVEVAFPECEDLYFHRCKGSYDGWLAELGLRCQDGSLATTGSGRLRERQAEIREGARLQVVASPRGHTARRSVSTAGELLKTVQEFGEASLFFERTRTQAEAACELRALLRSKGRLLQRDALGRLVVRFLGISRSLALDLQQDVCGHLDSCAGEVIGAAIAQLSRLDGIRLDNQQSLGDIGSAALARGLRLGGPGLNLRWLSLAGCNLGPSAARALAGVLGQLRTLEELNFDGNPGLGDGGGASLAAGLAQLGPQARLRELFLSSCGLGPAAAGELGGALAQLHCLVELQLHSNPDIGDAGGVKLAAGLASAGAIRKLDLQDCGFGPRTGEALGQAFRQLRSLDWLRLHDNVGLGDVGCAGIVAGLAGQCAHLRRLGMPNCGIGPGAARELGRVLRQLRSMDWLRIHHNPGLGDAGGVALAAGLADLGSAVGAVRSRAGTKDSAPPPPEHGQRPDDAPGPRRDSAQRLRSFARISGRGLHDCAGPGGGGGRLRMLDLNSCGLGLGSARALADALGRLLGLEELRIHDNPGFGDAGGVAIAGGLAALGLAEGASSGPQAWLWQLNLGNCGLGADAAVALASALSQLRALRLLEVQDNTALADGGCAQVLSGARAFASGRESEVEKVRLDGCGAGEEALEILGQFPKVLQEKIQL